MSKKKHSSPGVHDSSPIVTQRNKLKDTLNIKPFPWTEKQRSFIDLALDKKTKIIFLNGPAGTSKTLLGVYVGLELVAGTNKRMSDIIYVRTVVESASKGLGYLPGEFEDKFAPFLMPLEDKLEELISVGDIQKLKGDSRISAIPINYLRGASFNAKFILADESQNFDFKELTTLITRLGKFSKMIICGDTRQSDINGKSGFKKMFTIFNNEQSRDNGIHCVEFDKEDVMRSEEVKFILEMLERAPEFVTNLNC